MVGLNLENKVVIVTGAAMGMSESTAKLFAKAGSKVVVADYNAEAGQWVLSGDDQNDALMNVLLGNMGDMA